MSAGSGLRRSSRRTANSSSLADSDPDIDGLDLDDGSNPGTPSSVDGGNVKVSKLWTRKGKQEAGAFLGQFDPSKSGRERRKKNTNYSNIGNKKQHGNKAMVVYDDKGLLIESKLDLCDCLEDLCPGCHFPCLKCRSNKCGAECRQSRKWQYESLEVEGQENRTKKNLHLVTNRPGPGRPKN